MNDLAASDVTGDIIRPAALVPEPEGINQALLSQEEGEREGRLSSG